MSDSHIKTRKIIPIVNDPSKESFVSLYEAQTKVYPRSIGGYYHQWRWIIIWITQAVFYGLPWFEWGNRQALLLDISTHRFYIFGLVLYPQDLIFLVVLLVIAALALFLFTAVAGRLWCGFSCPQSVYTEIFLWIERKIEGDSYARIKLDKQKISLIKLNKKCIKHFIWISFSMWTGFTFLGYFTPIRDIFQEIINLRLSTWETFWICFYGFATYGNAGFLREQVCKYMCPYARFQSAMFDKDTLIVTYDQERGEPRSGRSRNVNSKQAGLGDCIDCKLCVQVCPVGIDIRDGLQYECISCGLCVDACNSIMDKMNYSRGLIRFSTLNGITNKYTEKEIAQKIMRPRVLIYTVILILLTAGFTLSLWLRSPFKLDVIRDRGVLSRLVTNGNVENVYRLQITNATEKPQIFSINVKGIDGLRISSEKKFEVSAAETRTVAVGLQIPDGSIETGSHPILFEMETSDKKEKIIEKSIFYMSR